MLTELSLYLGLFEAQWGNVDEALRKLETHSWLVQGLVEWPEDAHDREEG